MLEKVIHFRNEIVKIAGYGEMTISEIANRILSADPNRKYLTDCLSEEIEKLERKNDQGVNK
jgi:hypothetical protein